SGVADVDLGNILPVADVDFNGQKLIDVADPVNPQDVVTLAYFNAFLPSDAANRTLSNLQNPTAINQDLTFAPTGIRDLTFEATPAGAASSMRIVTEGGSLGSGGNISILTQTPVANTVLNSGAISVTTGANTLGAGSNFPTGSITLQTGQINNGGESGNTGDVTIRSGGNLTTVS
ncbi:MAG: hypothetical protein GWO26_18725, partial [Phycisphaerae bacterium]|nr:hypothetical protein [Phycisphaerae bacterium]